MSWQTSADEMGSRWVAGLSAPAWLGVEVGLLAIGLTCLLALFRARPMVWRVASITFAAGAVAWAISLAMAQSWIADDAFISFRYARNLAEGNGLVFNLSERVEGYTNFLWTVLLALGLKLGLAPAYASTAMTLGSLVALAVVGAWKLGRPGWVPLGPPLLVLSPAFIEFGTSGLEAAPTAMCVGFAALTLMDQQRRQLAAWWILIAALLRPDHALFFAPLGLLALFAGRAAIRHTVLAGLAFAVYWLGRWAYFGELFPNTFHAKSGGGAYWHQGSLYLAEFSLATGLWIAVPVVFGLAALLAIPGRKAREGRLPWAFFVFSFLGSALFAAYIARVGGDFMEFRFGLTFFVLFAFGADALLSRLAGERTWATVLAGLALLPLGLAPRLVKDGEKKWFIARESSFYRVKSWSPLEIDSNNWKIGESLAALPDMGATAPPLAAGCIGMIGYLSRLPIIDRFGLANARIARKPVTERGRPGHEKYATDAELRAEGAQWSVDAAWQEPLRTRARFRLGSADFWVLRQTPALSTAVKPPDPREVLAGIQSPEEALALHEDVSALYADLPEVLARWRAQWDLIDLRQFEAQGQAVELGLSRVSAREKLSLSIKLPCEVPHRLRWTVASGTCSAHEASCTDGDLSVVVSCTGERIELRSFTFEPSDLDARIRRALPLGAGALAQVVREQDDTLPGLISRFHFDSAEELTRPELELTEKLFDITGKPAPGQGAITGMRGKGLLNGFAWGDAPKGKLRLTLPVTPGKPVLVSFLFAGGSDCERIRAVVLDGDLPLLKACGSQNEVLRPFSGVMTPRSDRLVLELIDDDSGGWGHALADELLVWNLPPPDAN